MDSEDVQMTEKTPASPKVEKPRTTSSQKQTGSTKGLGRQIMNAIRKLQGQGTNLANIKSYLSRNEDTKQNQDAEIKMYLKNALDRGQVVKEAGNYKVAEKAQRKGAGGRRKRSVKTSPKKQAKKLAKHKSAKNAGIKLSKKRKSSKKSG